LEVEKGLWEKRVRKDASVKGLGPCDRIEGGIHAEKRKSVFVVKGRKRGGTSVYRGPAAKRVYLTL